MIDSSDGPCTVLREKHQKARKSHRCTECIRTIVRGETYLHETTLFDGNISTHKICPHCQAVRSWLAAECGGWVYGCVEEDLRQHVWEGVYPRALARAAVCMKQSWRNAKGELRPVPDLNPCLTHQPIRQETP
jgi:hypothetical protein